ncbi:MAG TPA: hypothetical protein VJV39_22000 [Dongiaceae bacterium]|nr:hypothetical protein [Dongiaceae bacterium]
MIKMLANAMMNRVVLRSFASRVGMMVMSWLPQDRRPSVFLAW